MQPTSMIGCGLLTAPVICCHDDQTVDEVVQLMHENQIRRLVVLRRRDDQITGVISLGDLATHADKKMSREVLQWVSEPV